MKENLKETVVSLVEEVESLTNEQKLTQARLDEIAKHKEALERGLREAFIYLRERYEKPNTQSSTLVSSQGSISVGSSNGPTNVTQQFTSVVDLDNGSLLDFTALVSTPHACPYVRRIGGKLYFKNHPLAPSDDMWKLLDTCAEFDKWLDGRRIYMVKIADRYISGENSTAVMCTLTKVLLRGRTVKCMEELLGKNQDRLGLLNKALQDAREANVNDLGKLPSIRLESSTGAKIRCIAALLRALGADDVLESVVLYYDPTAKPRRRKSKKGNE